MTELDVARALSRDPIENLTERYGAVVAQARKQTAALEQTLERLDGLTEQLAEQGLTFACDLGPVGNSARAGRIEGSTPRAVITFGGNEPLALKKGRA